MINITINLEKDEILIITVYFIVIIIMKRNIYNNNIIIVYTQTQYYIMSPLTILFNTVNIL